MFGLVEQREEKRPTIENGLKAGKLVEAG